MDAVDTIIEQWEHQGYSAKELVAMESIGRIKRLEALLSKEISQNLAERSGLSSWEFDVLATLRRSGAPYRLSPTVLFDTMMMSSGGLTHRIQQLEKKSLIIRVTNPDDKRSSLVQLSDQGLEIINTAVAVHINKENTLMQSLSTEEMNTLNALLKKINASLEDNI